MDSLLNLIPHFGKEENYFLGNGIVGAAVSAFGEVNLSVGCDYTSPNFIKSEKIYVEIDGVSHETNPLMFRVRHTGVFSGNCEIKGILFEIADFTLDGMPFLFRRIKVRNNSSGQKSIRILVDVLSDMSAESVNNTQLKITASTDVWCFGNQETKNWRERTCEISFVNNCNVYYKDNSINRLESRAFTLSAGEESSLLLYHYHFYEGERSEKLINNVLSMALNNGFDSMLEESVSFWNNWLKSGSFISDGSDIGDVTESCIFAVKMQQNRDGGTIAGIHKYANSYIRDSHGGHRLLVKTGHFEECKKIILNIHSKFMISGFIPNWWSMGSDTFIGESFNNNASEITAYYLFMIRDYISATKDEKLFETVYDSAIWAADVQLDFMKNNHYMLTFNGDETEQYTCKTDGEEYGGFPGIENWKHTNYSFSATAAALASLEFIALKLRENSKKERYSEHLDSIREAIDKYFYNSELKMHSWAVDSVSLSPLNNIVTNFDMIPLWIGAGLINEAEKNDALRMLEYVNPKTGFLPNSYPDVQGFCGHSLGLLLYCLVKCDKRTEAEKVLSVIFNSTLLGRWGTVSEFYGPGCVSNGHNYRCFESGILGEALLFFINKYKKERLKPHS